MGITNKLVYTLRGLNFPAIKFRGFRGFRKNREIKSRRKIYNGPSAKLNSHQQCFLTIMFEEINFGRAPGYPHLTPSPCPKIKLGQINSKSASTMLSDDI